MEIPYCLLFTRILFLFQRIWGLVLDSKYGFFGYVDTNGNIAIPCKYTAAYPFHEGLALVGNGPATSRFYSFINKKGDVVIDTVYDFAGDFSQGLAVLFRSGKSGYMNDSYQVVIDLKYTSAGRFSEGLGAVQSRNKWGFIDKNGTTIIPFSFDAVEEFNEGMCVFSDFNPDGSDGLKGYINNKGEKVIKPAYFTAAPFYNGIALVTDKSGLKYFWINPAAKAVSDTFEQVEMISKYLYLVRKNNKTSYFSNITRKLLSDFAILPGFQYGLAKIVKNGKVGMINMNCDLIIPLIYDDIGEYRSGILTARKGNFWGYIDNYNHNKTDFSFNKAKQIEKGFYLVEKNGKKAFLDKKFNKITAWYDEIEFDDFIGFIRTKDNHKCGISDSNGRVIAECIFDQVLKKIKLGNDLFLVQNKGKYAYLNLEGKIITDWYDKLDYAVARQIGRYFLLKNDGSILSGGYDEIQKLPKDSFYIYNLNGCFGFIQQQSGEVFEAVYDEVKPFAEGFSAVKKYGLWGYINDQGSVIIDFQYSAANGFYNHIARVTDKTGKSFYIDNKGRCVQGCN